MLCLPSAAGAQGIVKQKVAEKTRILLLLDGSGSMLEQWGRPTQTKISAAKSILTRIVDSLRQNKNLELALRVYGHRSPREAKNCKDTWLEVPFKANNHSEIIARIQDIKPKGVTPITYSLEQAAKDFPVNPGYRNIIILITDGIESCEGDPCATSRELQRKGVFLKPYIIGLGMLAERSLNCVGKFVDAKTPNEFHDILNQAIQTSFAKTTVSIELLDGARQPKETNVNVTFTNNLTGIAMYDFIHYLDAKGKPDSVSIDPVVEYDLMVSTVPPIYKKNVAIEPGKHNVIQISAAQGNLSFTQDGRKDNQVQLVIRKPEAPEILATQRTGEIVRYLEGKYKVETLTLPRRIFSVGIDAEKTYQLVLPAPGLVNFNTISSGFGALYEILDDGAQKWVCNTNNMRPQFALNLLPGNYKFVFRVKNANGAKYTAFKNFALKSGETKTIAVFN